MRQSSDRAADTRGPGEGWSETNSHPFPNLDRGGGMGTAEGGDDCESGLLSRARDGTHEDSESTMAPAFNNPELSPFSP